MIKFKYFSDSGILKRSGEITQHEEITNLREFAYGLHRDCRLPGLPSGRWFGPLIAEIITDSDELSEIVMCHTRCVSWVARDKDGQLKIFDRKPIFDKDSGVFGCVNDDTKMCIIFDEMFPEVKCGEFRSVR